MPSKSPAQARLMAAAAHTPGGYGGVPQSVGREFNAADKGGAMLKGKAMAGALRKHGKKGFRSFEAVDPRAHDWKVHEGPSPVAQTVD